MFSEPSGRTMRRQAAASLAGIAIILLSACGGGAAPQSSAAPASSAAKPPAAASSSAPAASSAAPVTASASAGASSGAPSGQPIRIGVLSEGSGIAPIEGAMTHLGVETGIQNINSTGGINGRPVEATYVDPRSDAAEAVQLATRLAQQDKVDVLMGGAVSAECLGVSKLAAQVGIVYLPTDGCGAEDLTSKVCNKDTFRVFPVGGMLLKPAVQYMVKTYGKKWAIVAQQSPFGDSQIAATEAALKAAGGELPIKIEVPQGEANVTPYVTKIPTDGSINGVFNAESGTDLARVTSVMQQFGITSKLPMEMAVGKENFGGVYPAAVNGAIITTFRTSEPLANSPVDQAFFQAFKATVAKNSQLGAVVGGTKAVPAQNGYEAYIVTMALKLAMRSSGFTGRADTNKLIAALENLKISQGPDAAAGDVIMNKKDHQGQMSLVMFKVNGQKDEVLQRIPAAQVPSIGNCDVNAPK